MLKYDKFKEVVETAESAVRAYLGQSYHVTPAHAFFPSVESIAKPSLPVPVIRFARAVVPNRNLWFGSTRSGLLAGWCYYLFPGEAREKPKRTTFVPRIAVNLNLIAHNDHTASRVAMTASAVVLHEVGHLLLKHVEPHYGPSIPATREQEEQSWLFAYTVLGMVTGDYSGYWRQFNEFEFDGAWQFS